jgi:hypothetical protein
MRLGCAQLATVKLFLLVCLLIGQIALAARTKKASKSDLEQIQQLINSKIERELPQSDAIFNQPPAFTRNPNAKHQPNELDINDLGEFFVRV